MNSNIEIEAKVLLKAQEYDTLFAFFQKNVPSIYDQTNYYIDGDDKFLKKVHHLSLRVRKIDTYDLTIKIPLKEGKKEVHQIIEEEEFLNLKNNQVFPKGDILNLLVKNNIDISKLKIINQLRTIRYEISYSGAIACLDKNFYNGKIDYELEVEASSLKKAEEICREILNKFNIFDIEFNKITKQARASL